MIEDNRMKKSLFGSDFGYDKEWVESSNYRPSGDIILAIHKTSDNPFNSNESNHTEEEKDDYDHKLRESLAV